MGESSEVLAEGDVVAARYVVESRIGRGGMGAVYAALDKRLGRRVALKAVFSKWARGATRQRLEVEARAVAGLAHDGIVTLFDVVEHDSELVLVLELVSGDSLRSVLAGGPLPPAEVARIVAGVADALGAAHEVGLVHRDVKPDNIILRPDGKTKLLDFGIATAIASSEIDPVGLTISASGQLVGTPAYLSPEQLLGEMVTSATDQFALAVTAYELMTGHFPWRAKTLALLASDILSAAPASLASRLDSVPEELEAVMRRALEKAPSDRFPSIRDFASALVDATAGLDTALEVAQPGPSDESARSASPAPHSTGAGAGPAFDPYSPTLESGRTDLPPLPAPAEKSRDPRRPGRALVGVVLALMLAAVIAIQFRAPTPSAAPTGSAPPEPAALAPQPFAELPASATESAVARAKYVEGVRNLSRGLSAPARVVLDEAIAADPKLASALLQRAYDSFRRSAALDEAGRAAFRGAMAERDALSPRDGELLDAMTPAFGDPPDWLRTSELLDAFVTKRPLDEQGWDAIAMAHVKRGDHARADREYTRVIELNPKAAVAYLIRAQILLVANETTRARELLAACLRAVPEAQSCRRQLAASILLDGDCEQGDRVAREMTATSPHEAAGFEMRAQAAAGLGAPDDAIAELLRQKRAEMPAGQRAVTEWLDAAWLAERRGDFDAALEALEKIERAIGTTDDELLGLIVIERSEVLWESGRAEQGAKVAAAFVDREAVRKAPERMSRDATARLLAFMREGRVIDADAYASRRDAWVRSWKARTDAVSWKESGASGWVRAFGSFEPTARDAADAMKVRVEFHAEPLPFGDPSFFDVLADAGALLIAAGKLDEAEVVLRVASRACAIVPDVRATYLLGTLLEKKGEKAPACAAFAEVERRWGKAKPLSVTARAAHEHGARCRGE